MSQNGTDFVTINVDGTEYQAPNSAPLIDALEHLGIEIPHYCYHPKLSVAGNCRMCMVEMGMPMRDRATGEPVLDEGGIQKIGWMPKPAIACSSKVMPGLHIRTDSEMTRSAREGVMEFLLVNHPLDCPICDQAGECSLQEFATDYGRGFSRFQDQKNPKPKRVKVGPRVTLDNERCILCSRCIRFCEEIDKDPVLGIVERGSYSMIATHPGRSLDSNYSLNTVDICPVGALTSTDFRFKMRVWFLKPVRSICTESSAGVNTEVWSREGSIYRITPRRNDAVNDTWMTDSGRTLYKQVEDPDRLKSCRIDSNQTTLSTALDRIRELVDLGPAAIVASGSLSTEEAFELKQFAARINAKVWSVSEPIEGDGRLVSEEAAANIRGALITGLIDSYPHSCLSDLAEALEAGQFSTVFAFGTDLTKAGISADILKKRNLVYIGSQKNASSAAARVCLPSLTVFEKSGTLINRQFRLQSFLQCVPGPAGILPETALISRMLEAITSEPASHSPSTTSIWTRMAASIAEFKGLTFNAIPEVGLTIDGSRFAGIDFPEKSAWHFEPAAMAETTAKTS